MKKHRNKYLLNKRLEFLNYAKIHIANNGLKQNTFKDISIKYKLDLNETELLFPEGNVDLIKFALEKLNSDLEVYCNKIDLINAKKFYKINLFANS